MTRRRLSPHCRVLLLDLSRYLEGDLTPARACALARHLDGCPCCGAIADRLKRTIKACRAAGHTRLPANVRSRARARIRHLLEDNHDAPRTRRS
mgnify:CR=1 FL=1